MPVLPPGRNTRKTRPTSFFGAFDQVEEDLSALDLPEGDPVSENIPSMLPWTWTRMGLPAASYRTWMVWMPPKAGP
jgi:hypothetical protein